uniref:Uncharacterized protein n=1 Tax=Panthera leo TaxID=9689 RepID=A0A8C8WUZ5_PANLE
TMFGSMGDELVETFSGRNGQVGLERVVDSIELHFSWDMDPFYLCGLETSMLLLEGIMNSILLFFCGSELLLEVLTLAAFSSMDRI